MAETATDCVRVCYVTGPMFPTGSMGKSPLVSSSHGRFLMLDSAALAPQVFFKVYNTLKYHQMFYSVLSAWLFSRHDPGHCGHVTVFTIIAAHPAFLADATPLTASAVSGHWSIYLQVTAFGAMAFAATMNVRGVCEGILHFAVWPVGLREFWFLH